MNKVIALLIAVCVGFGLWKFWPEIKGTFGKGDDEEDKSQAKQGPPVGVGTPDIDEPATPPNEPATNGSMPPRPIQVNLALYAKLDTSPDKLRYLVNVPSALRDAKFKYRGGIFGQQMSWEPVKERIGQEQFTFTSERNVPAEVVLEIQLDPSDQSPELRKVIGEHGELLAGTFLVKLGESNVIHAVARFRPDKLTFTDHVIEQIPLTRD